MSALLEEVYQLLNIQRICTTPYHSQTNGLIERFNSTLKAMLKNLSAATKKIGMTVCHTFSLLIGRCPRNSLASPHPLTLLYGRKVWEPLNILKGDVDWVPGWRGGDTQSNYVVKMSKRLEEMRDLVQKSMGQSQQRQKALYDKGTKKRRFNVGDQVLVLLPMQHNHLKLQWIGPYTVIRK